MDKQTMTAFNWMEFILLMPATIILAWKIVSDKFQGKRFSSDLIPGALLLASAIVGVVDLNIDSRKGWLRWTFLLIQLLLLVFLFKRLWSPMKEKLRQ